MRLMYVQFECGHCGHDIFGSLPSSMTIFDHTLDGSPIGPCMELGPQGCPKCGYVSNSILNKSNKDIDVIMRNHKYRLVFDEAKSDCNYSIDHLLPSYYAAKLYDYYDLPKLARLQNHLYMWHKDQDPEHVFVMNMILFKNEFMKVQSKYPFKYYMYIMDCYRLLGEYDKCRYLSNQIIKFVKFRKLNPFKKDDYDLAVKICRYEQFLCDNHDTKVHVVSDVK